MLDWGQVSNGDLGLLLAPLHHLIPGPPLARRGVADLLRGQLFANDHWIIHTQRKRAQRGPRL